MRKIKTGKKPQKKPLDKRTRIILAASIGVVVLIAIILFFIEGGGEKLIITNDTDLRLEEINVKFVYMEGDVTEPIIIKDIEAGDRVVTDFEEVDLYALGANLEISFKFEGFEKALKTDAGIFNDLFNGKAWISFKQLNDEIVRMNVKAKNGVFNSRLIDCDEEYYINVNEKYVGESYEG
jgi:hypothetical protein